MRKVFNSRSQKRHAKSRARYELKHKRERFGRVSAYLPVAPSRPIQRVTKKAKRSYRRLVAPSNFSLVENPDDVLQYFREAEVLLRSGRQVNFDLAGVTRMTPDAIALLVACVEDRQFRHGTNVAGNEPEDPVLATMFAESGFYSHVNSARTIASTDKNLLLHRVTENRVENEEAARACRLAVAHLFKDGRRIRPMYEVLIECMANTNNHANPGRRGYYDWWLFVYNDPHRLSTTFTFLDLGVGIFNSLHRRTFWRAALERLGLRGNLNILPRLLAGEIASRTAKPERGKGIPRINVHATGGTFRNFKLITNDVFADLVAGTHHYLHMPLRGTLFSFEICA